MADRLGATEVNRYGEPNTPGAKGIGNPGQLMQELSGNSAWIGIHVVDRAAIDPDRGQQAGVVARASEIRQDVISVEENGPACVSPLNGSVQVIPFVGPADRRVRSGLL